MTVRIVLNGKYSQADSVKKTMNSFKITESRCGLNLIGNDIIIIPSVDEAR